MQAETSLYERFLRLSNDYELVSPDLLIVPGKEVQADQDRQDTVGHHSEPKTILNSRSIDSIESIAKSIIDVTSDNT